MQNHSPDLTFRWQQGGRVLYVYFLLVTISAFLAGVVILVIPSDSKNSVFLGLSAQRLILLSVAWVISITTVLFSVKAYRNHSWVEAAWRSLLEHENRATIIRWVSAGGFLIGVIFSCMPAYRFGHFDAYFVRLYPLVVLLTFISALTAIISWIEKYGFHWREINRQDRAWKIALISLVIFALIWGIIVLTGLGTRVEEDYWYGAGVPVLGLQIVLALCAGLGVFMLEKYYLRALPTWTDWFVFFLIWALAAFLWVREPLPSNYFAPGPYPPNYEYYPYSDAVFYDVASQFALIGQGLNNGAFVGRALYMHFLLLLHTLLGQDFARLVSWQAAIYAVFPAILYLLGREIHGRPFGALFAVLIALRGVNGIAASAMINLANQKQMLSDFPTAIFVALFTYLMIKWMKAPTRSYLYVFWAGGVVGLGSMLRTHTLFFLLFALLLVFIVYKEWRHKLVVSLLTGIILLAAIIPWGMQSGGSLFNVYLQGIRSVIDQRYHLTPAPTPQGHYMHGAGNMERGRDVTRELLLSSVTQIKQDDPDSRSLPIFVSTHLLHNTLTSVFILPMSPLFHDLRHAVSDVGPFWEERWPENLDGGVLFWLIVNLLLIAIGIGIASGSNGLRGIVPIGSFLFYALANSFARTSGGRYIVPIDWIVLFYFSLGLFWVVLRAMSVFRSQEFSPTSEEREPATALPWTWKPLKRAPWIVLTFLAIGSLLPVSGNLFPRKYQDRSSTELLEVLESAGYLQQAGLDPAVLEVAIQRWSAFQITEGRALYPRYYLRDRGEPKNVVPYRTREYPRVAFMLIGPNGLNSVLLPLVGEPYLPNAADVMVIGCSSNTHIDALAVVVIAEETLIYMREPAAAMRCPVPEPVCDENHICR